MSQRITSLAGAPVGGFVKIAGFLVDVRDVLIGRYTASVRLRRQEVQPPDAPSRATSRHGT